MSSRAFLWLILLSFFPARSATLSDATLAGLTFEQKIGAQVFLDLPFRDENGKAVRLRDYFGRKPVILVPGYYQCPMLCTLTANGLVEGLADLKWSAGQEFEIVHVSIDPAETPSLALAKKQTYLRRYGRPGADAGWHFLTGDEPAIRQLTDEIGFQYAYDPASKQFAHASGVVILTPQGRVSRYLFGVTYAPNDLAASLQTAAASQAGSRVKQFVLLCFHYNPITGKYGAAIMFCLRVLGVATMVGFGWLITSALRRERNKILPEPAPEKAGSA